MGTHINAYPDSERNKYTLVIYETYFLQKLVTKVKPNINSVEVHPQLSNNGHPVDGALVCAGSRWPMLS
jgi:hypothetical protein